MTEHAFVIGADGAVLHHHAPPARTAVSLPDSRDLWLVLWAHRAIVAGVAHTHPGGGRPSPSREDLTTFAAVEAGLGRRLVWWIATADAVAAFAWGGPDRFGYTEVPLGEMPWLPALRATL